MARSRRSAYARLFAEPQRFRFDAAVRVLTRAARSADPIEAARFRTAPGLGYPAAEVAMLEPAKDGHTPELTSTVIGLTGPAGVLPRLYTEALTTTLRNRSHALHDFLDMLSNRIVAMFAGAGIKYRLNRSAEAAVATSPPQEDRIALALLALTGFATPHLVLRLAVGVEPLLHYSGFFSGRPRSAERLTALLSDWLGRDVEVVQFAGAWLPLPPDQRTSLAAGRHPGAWNRLAVDAAIGVRAWDPQARIILRIGPLDYPSFAALLPDHSGLQRLVSLVRAFLGYETGFAVNPVLAGPEVPTLRLDRGADPAPRLGWNTWIPAPAPAMAGIPRRDADDAIFDAEVVEAEELGGRARE
jgi:type VI secretion system protein ImpH